MKWRKSVVVLKDADGSCWLSNGDDRKQVSDENRYILDAVEGGMQDDKDILALIQKHERIDRVVAGFTLAGFLVEYAGFLEEDKGHYEIV